MMRRRIQPGSATAGLQRRGAVVAVALAAALSACTLVPPYERPAAPLAGSYPAGLSAGGGSALPAAATGWRDYYADPQLQDLIARALSHNRDLRAAVLRVEEARAAYGVQRADRYPGLGLAADAARSRTPADLSVTGQVRNSGQFQALLALPSWELDFWGRVRALSDAALETYLATDAARQAVTVSLVAQVAEGYLALRELDERIAIARRTIDTRRASHRIFSRRFEVGATSRLDLAQVETLLSQAEALGAQLEQARAVQAHALAVLAGGPVALPAVADPGHGSPVLAELAAGLPSELLTQRPDIIAAEHRLKAAHANIGAARAAFFPRIALTAAGGSASAALDGLFEPGSGSWRFAPSLSLPIFDGGRNRANLTLAEVRRDLAVAAYEKAVQTAFREVADALAARHWLGEQLRIQQTGLAAQAERARLAQLRYDSGAARYLEVLDAQRDLLQAEQGVVQTRRALLSSQVALYAALGGGPLDGGAHEAAGSRMTMGDTP